ncbi:AraC family transcriptional regulator [Bacillus taeanensis]|uniref:AraC family transcriptional regulator n=1 Tax=Bacillus taeanensis TaxID=273032 RepID=UPI0015EFF901|nr:AraC family transcriptional regulator [Bacillus taeanensis]
MSYTKGDISFGNYGFRFSEQPENNLANIWSIGLEKQTSTAYNWNGLKRKELGVCVFQYTLSGKGTLEIEGQSYPLTKGQAFLVTIPSEHHYFLPEDSEEWEFIFITLTGKEAFRCWEFINRKAGPVVTLSPHSTVIQLLINLYRETSMKQLKDGYTASAKAYEFIMECYRFAKNIEKVEHAIPDNIMRAITYMNTHYHEQITLNDIAEKVELSRFYFIKQFRKHFNMTPLHYLTKVRMEKAVELLRQTDFSIEEVALKTGYSNGNYFNKVFRKAVGTSAGQFREGKDIVPIDHLIID